ncbi:MAG: type II toxin-antitoxin system HicB family antitoxin [Candidatus Diapherotrites archaeon]
MEKKYAVVIERDEEGWLVGSVPELPGCYTQAKSMDQLTERIKEAIRAYLIAFEGKDEPVVEFVGVQQVNVQV